MHKAEADAHVLLITLLPDLPTLLTEYPSFSSFIIHHNRSCLMPTLFYLPTIYSILLYSTPLYSILLYSIITLRYSILLYSTKLCGLGLSPSSVGLKTKAFMWSKFSCPDDLHSATDDFNCSLHVNHFQYAAMQPQFECIQSFNQNGSNCSVDDVFIITIQLEKKIQNTNRS